MVAYRGMPKATTEELLFMSLIKLRPCCLCEPGQQVSPTECHHIKIGGKRAGHFFVLPYCRTFHHPIAHRYTHRERELWEKQNQEMGISREWPPSKILPRPVC
jgi:hypothetical protein